MIKSMESIAGWAREERMWLGVVSGDQRGEAAEDPGSQDRAYTLDQSHANWSRRLDQAHQGLRKEWPWVRLVKAWSTVHRSLITEWSIHLDQVMPGISALKPYTPQDVWIIIV